MLGIDIGSYSIKAAVVKKSGKKAIIEQVAAEVLPLEMRGGVADASSLQTLVSKLIKRVGKGHKTVALSIPTSSAILKTLDVDAGLNDDLLEGEIQLELVNFVPFPLDQVYADFIRLGRSKQNPDKEEVFVAASRRDIVDKIANSVTLKSISSKEIDVEAFAIGQVLEQIKGKSYREAYAVIDVGYRASTICVFQGGDMIFSRELQIGGHQLTEAIAEASGVELDEAEKRKHTALDSVPEVVIESYRDSVSEQMAMAFEFFVSTNSTNIQTVYLTGGGSIVSGLLENLTENLPNYQIEMLPIGLEIGIGKKTNGLSPEEVAGISAVSAGLSMRK